MKRAVLWLIDTAGSITGNRFRLVVASSGTATALILGSTLASGGDSGLASQLQQALAAMVGGSPSAPTPVTSTPTPTPTVAGASKGGGGVAPVSSTASSAPSTTPSTPKTPKTPTPQAGRVKHVFLIALNSPGFDGAFGPDSKMPYLAKTLRPQGQLLSNYSLLTDSGLPNYLAMIGGQAPNAATSGECATYTESCVYSAQTINVADQLFSGGFSWGAYLEDMGKPEPVVDGQAPPASPPQTCVHPSSGTADTTQHLRKADPGTGYAGSGYAVRHNPFVYFHSLLDLGSCQQRDVPLERLDGVLSSGTPNLTYIAPNLCHTGESAECDADVQDPGPAQTDQFLQTWVPKILASPSYRDGVVIVTFGEAQPAAGSAPVGTLLLSPFLAPGSTNAGAFNPYSVFRTIEDLFGLQKIAAGAGTGTTSFAPDLLGPGKKTTNKKKKGR